MTVPLITNIPIKGTDSKSVFEPKVDGLFPQLNNSFAAFNADATLVNSNATAASSAAVAAVAAAATAQANANYKGLWAGLTGTLNIPASVFHADALWMLTSNLANVTTATPGVSTAWLRIDGVGLAAPSALPSLLMDFEKSKTIDSRFTFARASAASRYNQYGYRETVASGLPRIKHDPFTLECEGLLLEQPSSNLILHSNDFTNAAWAKINFTVTANNALGADNTLSASTLTVGAGVQAELSQGLTQAGTTSQSFSVDIKSLDCAVAQISIFWLGSISETVSLRFNPITGEFISSARIGALFEGYSITKLKNGLFRVSVSGKGSNSANTVGQYTIYDLAPNACSLIIGAAQGEALAFETSYIATTTAAVTRVAESLALGTLSAQKWFNNKEGTLVVESSLNSASETTLDTITTSINDGTYANMILLKTYMGSGNCNCQAVSYVASLAVFYSAAVTKMVGEFSKHAIAYKNNDYAYAINGSGLNTGTGAVPNMTAFSMAVNGSQCLKQIAYYPIRLPNNELLTATRKT